MDKENDIDMIGFDFAKPPLKLKQIKPADYRAGMIVLSGKDFHDQDKLMKYGRLLFKALLLTMLKGGFYKRGKKYVAIVVSHEPIRRAKKRGKR